MNQYWLVVLPSEFNEPLQVYYGALVRVALKTVVSAKKNVTQNKLFFQINTPNLNFEIQTKTENYNIYSTFITARISVS